jgi:TonB family protein
MNDSTTFAKNFLTLICALFFCGSLQFAFAQEGFKGAPPPVFKRSVKKAGHASGAASPSKSAGKSIELNNQGDEFYDQGKYDEAVAAYQQAINLKPNYAEAYLNLGDAYSALQRNEEALAAYKKALRFKPNYGEAYIGLGDAYLALGKNEESEEAYSHISRNPSPGGARNDGGGGEVLNSTAISLPRPPYPPIAKAAHVSGPVRVKVVIDETGQVIRAHAIDGHPLLQAAAVQAAAAAKFPPTKLSGQPVKVTGVIIYNFSLQ